MTRSMSARPAIPPQPHEVTVACPAWINRWGCAPLRWRSVMGGTGDACTRPGPSVAREPKGRAFLQRSGREEPRGGGEKSSALGLRAAPALIGKPPCNRECGLYVDELMNRGMRTGVGGQRAKTHKRKRVERRH